MEEMLTLISPTSLAKEGRRKGKRETIRVIDSPWNTPLPGSLPFKSAEEVHLHSGVGPERSILYLTVPLLAEGWDVQCQ